MNMTDSKNKKTSVFKAAAFCLLAVISISFVSCDDGMDIQQSYPFTVETMPVPKELAKGETAEIRCELKREGEFADALYTIRYFQYDGKGALSLDNKLVLLPNDRYLLENEQFRLYYTSQCEESQNFIVVVEDNFGQSYELEFDFQHDNGNTTDEKDDDDGKIPFDPAIRDSVVIARPPIIRQSM